MMNFSRIIFRPKEKPVNGFSEDEEELIGDYLSSLYANGQISIEYNVVKNVECMFAYVAEADIDSLDEKYNSVYAARYKGKIELKYEVSYEKLGTSIYTSDVCTCKNTSYYMLISDYISPISCGDCGNAIPSYKLPFIGTHGNEDKYPQEDHHIENSWQRYYKAIDGLWMGCLADRWTARQLVDPKSQLSKIGREICSKIERVTGKKAYYYLLEHIYDYQMSDTRAKPPQKLCPSCGGDWRAEDTNDPETFLFCDNCRLTTKKHW